MADQLPQRRALRIGSSGRYLPNQNGIATITVRATDLSGAWVEDTCTMSGGRCFEPYRKVTLPAGAVAYCA